MSCDTSHGWVKPRADGARAKCGGPSICTTCQTEQMHQSMLDGIFGASHEALSTSAQRPGTAQRAPYGSPIEIAGRIEAWISNYGQQDTASLLLYEAMKALRAHAATTTAGGAEC